MERRVRTPAKKGEAVVRKKRTWAAEVAIDKIKSFNATFIEIIGEVSY